MSDLKQQILAKDQSLMTTALLACQSYIGHLEKQLKMKVGENPDSIADKYYRAMHELALFEDNFPGKVNKRSLPVAPWVPNTFDQMIGQLELELN